MTWSRTNLEDDILWVPMEEADAEIERLRGLEAAFHAEIKAMRDTIPPLIEDNERLRGLLKDAGVPEWVIDGVREALGG